MKKEELVKYIYRARFTQDELVMKRSIWHIITLNYLQQYVPRDSDILDVGAGNCEFINSIRTSGKKVALDINPDVKIYCGIDVNLVLDDCRTMHKLKENSFDIVFVSNLLEHMRSPDEVEQVLISCKRVLRPGGHLLIMQPNIKYAYKQYWDYFDHVTPLSHDSVCEALFKCGMTPVKVVKRLLPYSTRAKVPKHTILIQLYLEMPILWPIFGKQMFVIAENKAPDFYDEDD